jgi:hypothetical protein
MAVELTNWDQWVAAPPDREASVADTPLHGTTRQQVGRAFA